MSGTPADSPVLADFAADLLAVYVHIPFCHRVCPYCDFAVVAGVAERLRQAPGGERIGRETRVHHDDGADHLLLFQIRIEER